MITLDARQKTFLMHRLSMQDVILDSLQDTPAAAVASELAASVAKLTEEVDANCLSCKYTAVDMAVLEDVFAASTFFAYDEDLPPPGHIAPCWRAVQVLRQRLESFRIFVEEPPKGDGL